MAKINGTNLLVYDNGTLIAAQKGVTVNTSQNLFDTTNKESAGWSEHGNGMRSADISIDGLASTTGLSAKELFAHIISRTSLLLVVDGLDYPLVCQADIPSSSITGPMEDAATITGSFKVNGNLYYLSGTSVQMITDVSSGGTDYDTLTKSGTAITSAINAAGTAFCMSNTISVANGGVYKLFLFLTTNSGELPSVALYDNTSADISNVAALVAGLNVVTLTSTANDASASLRFRNTGAANWSTSNMYLFKV